VAEGARLESVYAGNRIEGSNPSPSATLRFRLRVAGHLMAWRTNRLGVGVPAVALAKAGCRNVVRIFPQSCERQHLRRLDE